MIEFIQLIIIFVFGLFTLFLCTELIVGTLFFSLKQNSIQNKNNLRNIVLIPAHNEELVIADTLLALKQQISKLDSIVVVADNCSDATVDICKEHDVQVLERHSQTQKGKGYALDYGAKWVADNKDFDNLILFDADCIFTANSFEQLTYSAFTSGRICQSCYLMMANTDNPKTKIAEFTWWLKNAIRATGLNKMGIGCHIQGSGIAFPKETLKNVSFASGSIVEDLELGLKLSIAKNRVLFTANSKVISHFPNNQEGLAEQRKRWEHGHLDTVMKAPLFLSSAIKNKSIRALFLILDSAIPPLFAYMTLVGFSLVIGIIAARFTTPILFYAMFANMSVLIIALLIVWLVKGHKILSLQDIPDIFRFIWEKVGIYFSFATSKQTSWNKTTRDNNSNEKD
jgi:cellulose synthase/poly-beta-1,6-N-acetylglucosamine synthase-like glycosyltransferase